MQLNNLLSPGVVRTTLIVVCFSLVCVLGNRLHARKDFTANSIHTLKPQSVETLQLLNEPLEAEVFINPQDPQTGAVSELFAQYQQHKPDLTATLSDPALDPQRMRELDVANGGEIFLRYQNRTQRLTELSEQSLTMAMQRLARTDIRKLTFTVGHGERSINGQSNADFQLLAQQLKDAGFEIDNINLSDHSALTTDIGTLVIAGPIHRFIANEVLVLLDYISNGGNLIWLTEPDSDDGLKALALELGIERLPGVVVDLAAQQLQVERPDFAVASSYSTHAATNGFSAITLFPQAAALNADTEREWRVAALVQTGDQAWTETGALTGKVEFGDDQQELKGPLPLLLSLERERANKMQRVIVAGDGDFLADAWIANGGNRDLANRLFNWSVEDTQMIGISAPVQSDAQLNLSKSGKLILAAFALLILPGLMFGAATGVWYQRQHG